MTRISLVLLMSILLTLEACGVPSPLCFRMTCPGPYYREFEIGADTYSILYMNYFMNELSPTYLAPVPVDPLDERLLKGAQEHVLYRAGELARSKGAKYFAVLHKDDWNIISEWSRFNNRLVYSPNYEPGAGIVIRLLSEQVRSLQSSNDRVYEVNTLLKDLSERNPSLAEYSKRVHEEELLQNDSAGFRRWRSSVTDYDTLDSFKAKYEALYGKGVGSAWPSDSTIETKVTPRVPSDSFELSISDRRLIAPLRFLHECVQLADKHGYEVFKLVNWTPEEHRTKRLSGRLYIWFQTKATVVLQHHSEPESLDPVFVVNEIRKQIEIGRVWP